MLGVAAVSSALAAGVGGIAFGVTRGEPVHAAIGLFWILMAYSSLRVYRGLCVSDDDLVGSPTESPG